MSGHNKWSKIKRQKGKEDKKRSKMFTKIVHQIVVAVKDHSDGDPETNADLRSAIDKAKEVNMPKDNIQNAIDRALGKGEEGALEEIVYEGYAPGGVGIMVKVLTDNTNRTASQIKTLFDRHGGSLGAPGSVSYLREIKPIPMIDLQGGDGEKCENLIEKLDDHEDVVGVWNNLDSGNE